VLSLNDIMDIWQLPHVPDGDKRYIRKEYTEISQLDQVADLQKQLADAQNKLNATAAPTTTEEDGNDPEHEDQAEE
jgi:esterase/lipase